MKWKEERTGFQIARPLEDLYLQLNQFIFCGLFEELPANQSPGENQYTI